jgi:hypothetical protein
MLGKNGDLGEDADPEPGRHGRLNAQNTRAHIGDVPAATHRFQRTDREVAVNAPLIEHGERQRIASRVDRPAPAGDPAQALAPERDAARLRRIALEQSQIEVATFERALHLFTRPAAHRET